MSGDIKHMMLMEGRQVARRVVGMSPSSTVDTRLQ